MWIFLQHPCNPSYIDFQHLQAVRCSWSGIGPHWTRDSLAEMTYRSASLNHCMKETGNSSGFTRAHLDFTKGSPKLLVVLKVFQTKTFSKRCLPHRFCNFHVSTVFHKWIQMACFRWTSRDFLQKTGPVHATNPGLLSKMTLLQTSQSRLES